MKDQVHMNVIAPPHPTHPNVQRSMSNVMKPQNTVKTKGKRRWCKKTRARKREKHCKNQCKWTKAENITRRNSCSCPPPPPPPGQHCREAENTVKNSTKCTISSVSAREHPVGGNFQQNYYSFTQLSAFEAFDWPTRSGWRLFLNIGMEYVKIIKAETLNLMINSYYLNNILWSTHLPKHKHKARTTPTIIPSRWHITWAPNLPPNPTWKKTSKPSMTRWTPT